MGWPVLFGNHEDYIVKLAGICRSGGSDWWLLSRAVEELNARKSLPEDAALVYVITIFRDCRRSGSCMAVCVS
jgi:hypothetical protein